MRIFGREPTLWISVIASVLSLVAGFGLDWMTAEQASLIVVGLNALLGIWNGLAVRPVAPAAFTYAVGALAAVAAAYGLDVSQEMVGSINVVVVAVLALLTRGQVSPTVDGNHPVYSRR